MKDFDPLKAYKRMTGEQVEYLKDREPLSEYKKKEVKLDDNNEEIRNSILNLY